jgi:hypothetical protein
MSRVGKFVVIVAVIYFVGSTMFFVHRTDLSQLLALPLFFCFLGAIIAGIVCVFSDWRKHRWLAFLPIAVCVVSVCVSGMVVGPIRHAIFVQSLPSYEAVVRQIESGSIPVSTNLSPVPQAVPLAHLAYAVFAEKRSDGALTIEFLTEGGFPVKHSGYLYVSSGVIESGSMEDERWPIRQEERPRWFYISN